MAPIPEIYTFLATLSKTLCTSISLVLTTAKSRYAAIRTALILSSRNPNNEIFIATNEML